MPSKKNSTPTRKSGRGETKDLVLKYLNKCKQAKTAAEISSGTQLSVEQVRGGLRRLWEACQIMRSGAAPKFKWSVLDEKVRGVMEKIPDPPHLPQKPLVPAPLRAEDQSSEDQDQDDDDESSPSDDLVKQEAQKADPLPPDSESGFLS